MCKRRCQVHFLAAFLFAGLMVFAGCVPPGTGNTSTSPGARVVTYGTNGMVSLNVGTSITEPEAMALQSSGKTVLLYQTFGDFVESRVTRQNADGSTDAAFGTNGVTRLIPSSIRMNVLSGFSCMAVLPDDKIILGGRQYVGSSYGLWLCRLTAAGAIDTGFGTNGYFYSATGYGSGCDWIGAQSNGTILAVGQDGSSTVVSCFNSSGTLDLSYGSSGIRTVSGNFRIAGIDPSGRLVLANSITLARLTTAGALDSAFGTSGIATIDFNMVRGLACSPNGTIVLCGENSTSQAILKYYSGTGGYQFTSRSVSGGTEAIFESCAIDANGIIFAAGTVTASSTTGYGILACIDTGGFLFSGFSTDGVVEIQEGVLKTRCSSVILRNGAPVVAGYSEFFNSTEGKGADLVIASYTLTGDADLSYSGDGREIMPAGNSFDMVTNFAALPDGSCLVLGVSGYGWNGVSVLFKINPSGAVDSTFAGGQGSVIICDPEVNYRDCAVFPNGKILLLGARDPNRNFINASIFLQRLNADGSADTSFGSGGSIEWNLAANNEAPSVIAMLPTGQFFVGGRITVSSHEELYVAKFNQNGSFDTGFDSDGLSALTSGVAISEATALAVQTDGSILVAGGSSATPGKSIIIRYTQAGAIDSTFGTAGIYQASYFAGGEKVTALGLQSDGKIIGASTNTDAYSTGNRSYLFRLTSSGVSDASWGTSGRIVHENVEILDLAIQTDGKLLVPVMSGSTVTMSLTWNVYRYLAAGTSDTGFGTTGMVTTDWGGYSNIPWAVGVLTNGKFLVGGCYNAGSGFDLGVAEYYQ